MLTSLRGKFARPSGAHVVIALIVLYMEYGVLRTLLLTPSKIWILREPATEYSGQQTLWTLFASIPTYIRCRNGALIN